MFKRSIILLTLITIRLFAQTNEAKSELEIEADITKIKQKLVILKSKLNKAYGQEHVLIEELEAQDNKINKVSNEVSVSNKQLNEILIRIKSINKNIDTKSKSIEKQRNQVISLLKFQVYLNHDKTLKMLLINPANSQTVQSKHVIKYLNHHLFNLIEEVAKHIQQLETLKASQIVLQQQENHKQQLLLVQQGDLVEQRKQRLKILNKLKNEIAKHKTESKNLNQDQSRLAQLLAEIQVLLSDLPKDLGSNKPFFKLKGKFIRPVKGSYIRSFHSRRSENTRWDGIVIKASIGDDIKAIAYGRVAFADWLRGFGMLVILDHQDGYMSLYGFNESIIVEVGDWVDSRQKIATIGNSGSLAMPALYFEIRKDALPLNPKMWVK